MPKTLDWYSSRLTASCQYRDWMTVVDEGNAIICGVCKMTSRNPNDIEYGYCGNCHMNYKVRRGLTMNVEECGLCGEVEFGSGPHVCDGDEWDPVKVYTFSECANCGCTSSDSGGVCDRCGTGASMRLAMLFETDAY